MYCPKCGSRIENQQRYCPSCGELLGADTNTDESQSRPEILISEANQQINSIGGYFINNSFRIIIGTLMLAVSVLLIKTFVNEFGTSFSSLSGLEKRDAAVSTLIYVLSVFIPVLVSLESIRKTFYISAKLNPKEFNIKKYAVSKASLLPIVVALLLCLAMVITPFILYNYKGNEMLMSLASILGGYKTPAIISCFLCIISLMLVNVSRKRIKQI